DPPRNARITLTNFIPIMVSQLLELFVDVSNFSSFSYVARKLELWSLAHGHVQAFVGENLHLFDVLDRLSRHHRVRATGVVAQHSPQRAVLVGSWIGSKVRWKRSAASRSWSQMMPGCTWA